MKKTLALLLGILLGCAFTVEYHRLYPSLQAEEKNQEMIRILFVGDIMPSRYVARTMESKGYDFPFEKTAAIIQDADIAFANLESPIIPGKKVRAGEMRFRTDPQFVPSLNKAGFDIVTLANNHMYDYGEKGLTQTLATLSANNIEHIGAGSIDDAYRPKYIEKKGVRVAFIGQNDRTPVPEYTCATESHPGTACFDQKKLRAAITQAKAHADFIVFTMHAGTEYTSVPNSLQKTYAYAAIDAGADLVIGHHPHVIQEREQYHGKWIYYSLGNFVFDQAWSRETSLGLMLVASIGVKDIQLKQITPKIVAIHDFAQPQIATDDDIAERFGILDLP